MSKRRQRLYCLRRRSLIECKRVRQSGKRSKERVEWVRKEWGRIEKEGEEGWMEDCMLYILIKQCVKVCVWKCDGRMFGLSVRIWLSSVMEEGRGRNLSGDTLVTEVVVDEGGE